MGPNQQPAQPPSVYSAESVKQNVWNVLVHAAAAHMAAVQEAIEATTPTELPPAHLVTAVLQKGDKLDSAIMQARLHGWTPGEIAEIEGLHPAYIAELLRMTGGHRAL